MRRWLTRMERRLMWWLGYQPVSPELHLFWGAHCPTCGALLRIDRARKSDHIKRRKKP